MKMLLISNMYPSKDYISYGIFVKNTKELLEKNEVEFSGVVAIKGRTEKKISKIKNYLFLYLSFFYHLIFKRFHIGYIHYFGFYSIVIILFLKLFGKKIVLNIHGSDILATSKTTYCLQKIIIRYIDLIVLPSQYFKEKFKEKFSTFKGAKVYIYPSGGINLNIFRKRNREKLLKKYKINKNFIIGYVSHINNNKGWLEFLKAVELFHNNVTVDIQILIVGTGQNEMEFNEFLSNQLIYKKVKRYTKLPQNELSEIFNLMDVYIFPTRSEESLGLVGLEAMACEVPVIGSEIGALPFYIDNNKNGYLVNVGDYDDIYNKLKLYYYLSDSNKLKMKKRCIKKAYSFDADKVTKLLKQEFINLNEK